MVARINTSKSIIRALNYNEKKVQMGKAEILHAAGFLKSLHRLNFYDKIRRFQSLTSLNHRTVTNCLHVSLNFDPSENLTNEKMEGIANAYMDKIGFGQQPYLIYRHFDSGHPHMHIVSTNIKKNGERISMHRIGGNQSEKARKEIEVEFKLVKAAYKNPLTEKFLPVNNAKVVYGKSELKRSISNVLDLVIAHFKVSSLLELNAVLGLYNIRAERGEPGTRMFNKKGLVFTALDEKGKKTGVAIKASLFYMKPTLKMLEGKFKENEILKSNYRGQVLATILWVFNKRPKDMASFSKELEKEGIQLVLRKGKSDIIYGLTYVDLKHKVVFNGSELGKRFSANAVLKSFSHHNRLKFATVIALPTAINKEAVKYIIGHTFDWKLSILPTTVATPYEPIPFPFRIKKKKRKKKHRNL